MRRPMRRCLVDDAQQCWSSTKPASVRSSLPRRSTQIERVTVDHDLADGVVAQERLERPVAENIVGDLAGHLSALLARQRRLVERDRFFDRLRTRGSMLASRPSSPPAAKRRGPSRVITSWWTRDLRSANGSVGAGARLGLGVLLAGDGSGLLRVARLVRSERLNSRRLFVLRLGELRHARIEQAVAAGGRLLARASAPACRRAAALGIGGPDLREEELCELPA